MKHLGKKETDRRFKLALRIQYLRSEVQNPSISDLRRDGLRKELNSILIKLTGEN